jgi:hypothetical protein
MLYVVVGIIFLLVIGGAVTMFVMSATKNSTPASPEPGDDTEVGDTPQHADEDHNESRTSPQEEPEGGRYKRDPIGGEAEAETAIDVGEAPTPRG